MKKFSVLGAGAWGTTLAQILAQNGNDVTLWAREEEVIEEIKTKHTNSLFLPDVTLSENISPTNSFEEALKAPDAVLLVIPSQHLRQSCKTLRPLWKKDLPAIVCSKGIEQSTGLLLSEMLETELPEAKIAVLSGPTFAQEAALLKPTAITLACKEEQIGQKIVEALSTQTFRPYYSDDIISVQVGGAVKNVIAIAAGLVEGKKLGDNARAALITRGLAEISRLSLALGGNPQTLMGLAGLGDLVLTASSKQSRNFTVGQELGEGKSLNDILGTKHSVAEGVFTASAVLERAKKLNVEMPICEGLNKIMHENVPVDSVIQSLFARPLKYENKF